MSPMLSCRPLRPEVDGTAKGSVAASMTMQWNGQSSAEDVRLASILPGTMYLAGADSTVCALQTFAPWDGTLSGSATRRAGRDRRCAQKCIFDEDKLSYVVLKESSDGIPSPHLEGEHDGLYPTRSLYQHAHQPSRTVSRRAIRTSSQQAPSWLEMHRRLCTTPRHSPIEPSRFHPERKYRSAKLVSTGT